MFHPSFYRSLFVFRNKENAQPPDEKQTSSSNYCERDSLLGKTTSHHFKYDDQLNNDTINWNGGLLFFIYWKLQMR